MSEQYLQDDAVSELRKSRKVVGELSSVIWDDRRNEPVSGAHRVKAGWKRIDHIRTKDDLEFFKLKLHHNIQRQMPPGEKVGLLAAYGDALLKSGKSPGTEIMDLLLEVSPWDERYTYEMVPRRFKSGEGRPLGSPSLRTTQTQSPPDGFEPDTGEVQQHFVTCSRCGLKGEVIAGILSEQA